MRYLVLACCLAAVSSGPTVKTRLRYITGLVYEMRGIELFYGIPYATPPTAENDLRFELPRPNEESSNLTATRYVSGCTDGTFLEREDCLYLDVCRRAGTQPEDRKPVLVFLWGSYSLRSRDGFAILENVATQGDVISVTVRSRLGVFGFANFGGLNSGNVGFFDQRLALEWVKDNIEAFGGNPDDITIAGSGFGSVHAQIVTPLNLERKLFNAAFINSGFLGVGLREEAGKSVSRLEKLARAAGCDHPEELDRFRCLKRLDFGELIKALQMTFMMNRLGESPVFYPTIDGVFVPKHVDEMDANDFADVKLMVGVAKDDGSYFVNGGKHELRIPDTEDDFLKYVSERGETLQFLFQTNITDPESRRKLVAAYFNQYPTQFERVTRFITESSFICPATRFVERYAKHNQNVYAYHFEKPYPDITFGCHEYLGAFYGTPTLYFLKYHIDACHDDVEDKFREDLFDVFLKFVRTNHVPELRRVPWPDFAESGQVLRIDQTPSIADGFPQQGNCKEMFP